VNDASEWWPGKLRGSRDFESLKAYEKFVQEVVRCRNSTKRERWGEEFKALKRVPLTTLYRRERLIKRRVDIGSLVIIDHCAYSVPNRYIGEWLECRITATTLKLYHKRALIRECEVGKARGQVHCGAARSLFQEIEYFNQLGYFEGFAQVSVCTLCTARISGSRHDNDLGQWASAGGVCQHFFPPKLRHDKIRDHQIEMLFLKTGNTTLAILGCLDAMSHLRKQFRDERQKVSPSVESQARDSRPRHWPLRKTSSA